MRQCLFVATLIISTLAEPCLALTIRATTSGNLKSIATGKDVAIDANSDKSITLSEPALFTSADTVPVLLVPVCPPTIQRIDLAPPSVRETSAVREATQKLNDGMVAFADGYGDFETALSAKNLNEAEIKLNQLVTRFPGVPFFYLPRASLAYLRGHRAEARGLLEKYLEQKPNDSHATKLLNFLKGGSR